LRHPRATSTFDELATGGYQEVIDDNAADVDKVDTVVLCSGKFYYEITEQAQERGVENAAFVRVEQLYPLPKTQLDAINAKYKNAKQVIWAQEEPENMGAWSYMYMAMKNPDMSVVARRASSAPATGSSQTHKKRLTVLYNELFEKIASK
jgi:2-oxoglutarate dehydrogenase E1 component